ncbi:MAG TPA: hypothetical protein PKY46_10220 [Ignavibacteriaceae bacterium]|nr:hypothetical protein [Ignavibacteriaceae bacterium]
MNDIIEPKSDLYKKGMDTIIASSILYSTPFYVRGKQILEQFEKISGQVPEKLNPETINNFPLEDFLSDFFNYSNVFIEKVSLTFSEIIRKTTTRVDIRQKTTESIADEIRSESFKQFNKVLEKYTQIMGELGVRLASVSSIRAAVEGTFVGGGLQLMGTRGQSSGTGMLVGALIGAAAAEADKLQIRNQLLQTAFEGIKETIIALPICNQKLMDQYSSYIFGGEIDFDERDRQLERGEKILEDIKVNCTTVMDHMVSGSDFWRDSTMKIIKAQKGTSFVKIYLISALILIAIVAIINPKSGDLSGIIIIGPVLVYFFYLIFMKKPLVKTEKTKILEVINAEKSKFTHLKNSIDKLTTYAESFKF